SSDFFPFLSYLFFSFSSPTLSIKLFVSFLSAPGTVCSFISQPRRRRCVMGKSLGSLPLSFSFSFSFLFSSCRFRISLNPWAFLLSLFFTFHRLPLLFS
ncbi:hypothetical protein Tsubulata_042445, partial [Turnera subulata]